MSHSFEILPSLKAAQSTLPAPTLQLSPRTAQNSVSVKPGGRRLITSLSLGAGVLDEGLDVDCAGAFFLVAALTGKTPPERPFVELDIVGVSKSLVSERTMIDPFRYLSPVLHLNFRGPSCGGQLPQWLLFGQSVCGVSHSNSEVHLC